MISVIGIHRNYTQYVEYCQELFSDRIEKSKTKLSGGKNDQLQTLLRDASEKGRHRVQPDLQAGFLGEHLSQNEKRNGDQH